MPMVFFKAMNSPFCAFTLGRKTPYYILSGVCLPLFSLGQDLDFSILQWIHLTLKFKYPIQYAWQGEPGEVVRLANQNGSFGTFVVYNVLSYSEMAILFLYFSLRFACLSFIGKKGQERPKAHWWISLGIRLRLPRLGWTETCGKWRRGTLRYRISCSLTRLCLHALIHSLIQRILK